jgi:hypothetical protein
MLALITFFIMDRNVTGLGIPRLSFLSSKKGSAYTVAEEVSDLYLLNTSEYKLKLIFPHDFVDRDISWWAVKEIYERRLDVDEDQQELVDIYKACLNSGFDPAVDVYDFIIMTAIVKAGINISGTMFENPSLYQEERFDSYLRIEGDGPEKTVFLHIPPVEITELYIDDRKPSDDNFPDAQLTPARWKELVDFLNPKIREKVIELGILEDAGENSRELISKLLRENGFSRVSFTERKL